MFMKMSAVFSLSMVCSVSSSATGDDVSFDESVLVWPSSARSDRYLWFVFAELSPSSCARYVELFMLV